MKIVRYNNDCVILNGVLNVEMVEKEVSRPIGKYEIFPSKYETIIRNRIRFYFQNKELYLQMPSKEEAIKAYNKIIDFLQNDEKLLDLTNQETQCL